MTVKELIEKLQQYPDNLEVHIGDEENTITYVDRQDTCDEPDYGINGSIIVIY